jgi:hypothetical protein
METPAAVPTPAKMQSPDAIPPTALADAAPDNAEAIETSNGQHDTPNGQEKIKVPGQILDLSENVISFLKKIEPLKVLMSPELQTEMAGVVTWAEECKGAAAQ